MQSRLHSVVNLGTGTGTGIGVGTGAGSGGLSNELIRKAYWQSQAFQAWCSDESTALVQRSCNYVLAVARLVECLRALFYGVGTMVEHVFSGQGYWYLDSLRYAISTRSALAYSSPHWSVQ